MLTAIFFAVGLLGVAALPWWPHSRAWGYVPAAGIALLLFLLLVMHLHFMI